MARPQAPILPPVARALFAQGIPHRVFRHPRPVSSLEQAAAERGQDPAQVVRSILFRLEADAYVLVLVNGSRRIDWKALRRHLGRSRIALARPEEVREVTGYTVGTVGPLGLARPIPVLVDEGVLEQEEISIGSGEPGTAVILRAADLLAGLGPHEIGRFAEPPQAN